MKLKIFSCVNQLLDFMKVNLLLFLGCYLSDKAAQFGYQGMCDALYESWKYL